MQMSGYNFGIGIEVQNDSGELLAVYFQVRKGKVSETREFEDGNVFADYNARGELLGIEVLGPAKLSTLDEIIGEDALMQQFVRRSVPREMALA
jgi:uncharacterized protein YuzE